MFQITTESKKKWQYLYNTWRLVKVEIKTYQNLNTYNVYFQIVNLKGVNVSGIHDGADDDNGDDDDDDGDDNDD